MKKVVSLILSMAIMLSLVTVASAENYDKVFTDDGNEIMELSNIVFDDWYDMPFSNELGYIECEAGAEAKLLIDSVFAGVYYFADGTGTMAIDEGDIVVPEGFGIADFKGKRDLEIAPAGTVYRLKKPGCYIMEFGRETDGGFSMAAYAVDVVPAKAFSAVSKSQPVIFSQTSTKMEAYNIRDNNYFKLRDICMSLTEAGFPIDVTWDGEKNAINLIKGQDYTAVGGEMTVNDGENRDAVYSGSTVYLDGEEISLKAYNIAGNNFFMLRDLCKALDIFIEWDAEAQSILVDCFCGYDAITE